MTATEPQAHTAASGILNIDKPAGWTSHDVVALIRGLTGQRRIGHAGTLDPAATGVLLLCLGLATRMVTYLTDGTKVYRATIHLGTTTDTYDADGNVLTTVPRAYVEAIDRYQIEQTLKKYLGWIEQVPPMYSAIKQQGQQLYKLARQGIEIERMPRPVEIRSVEICSYTPPFLELRITCSKGTYIRSLAHDIGRDLGVGGYLAALVREASGHFRIEDAIPLDEFRRRCSEGTWGELLLPTDEALLDFDVLILQPASIRRLVDGIPFKGKATQYDISSGTICRVYSSDGQFSAIVEKQSQGWKLIKHFIQ